MNINMQTEPVAILSAIEVAGIAVVTAIGVLMGWESEVTAAVVGLFSAAIVLIGAILKRRSVYSPATHAADVETALNTPVPQ